MTASQDHLICWEAKDLPSQTGCCCDSSRCACAPENGAGFLTYGPYICLPPARYKATVTYSAEVGGKASGSFFEVGDFTSKPPVIFGRTNLEAKDAGVASLEFQVSAAAFDKVEMRIFFSGKGQLTIHRLVLEELSMTGIMAKIRSALKPVKKPGSIVINNFGTLDSFVDDFRTNNTGGMDAISFVRAHKIDIAPFMELFGGRQPHSDPFSREYAEWERSFFEFLSGRAYNSINEGLSLNLQQELSSPPQLNLPLKHKITSLRSYADLLEIVEPNSGQRILEMGCGHGNLVEILGRCGCKICAIEASLDFAQLTKARLASQFITAEIHNGSFYDLTELPGLFDMVFFEASFHHCGEAVRLLTALHEKTPPDGRLIFFHEVFESYYDRPWGIVRYDGESMLQIRMRGWLELGYRLDFFQELLKRTGWQLARQQRISDGSMLYVAKKL